MKANEEGESQQGRWKVGATEEGDGQQGRMRVNKGG